MLSPAVEAFAVASDMMTGPPSTFSTDAVAAAKIRFAKTNDKLVIAAAPTVARPSTPTASNSSPASPKEVLLAQLLGVDAVPGVAHRAAVAAVAEQKGGAVAA